MFQEQSQASYTIELAAELTAAWLANPNTRASSEDVPAFLSSMHAALAGLSAGHQQGETGATAGGVYPGRFRS
jgi:predicted transcriptional regulator